MIPRYKRMKRRDWKDPFSWFNWRAFVVSGTRWNEDNVVASEVRLASDGTTRLASDGVTRTTSGY